MNKFTEHYFSFVLKIFALLSNFTADSHCLYTCLMYVFMIYLQDDFSDLYLNLQYDVYMFIHSIMYMFIYNMTYIYVYLQ